MGSQGNLHTFDEFYYPMQNGRGGDTFYTSNPGGESLGAYSFAQSNVWKLFMSSSSPGTAGQSVALVYRFYSDSIVDHLYKFGSGVPSSAYVLEGAIGAAFTSSGPYRQPIYRYYNPPTGDHKYSTSGSTPSGWVYEGVAWYSPIPVYGCKDPNASNYNPYANQPSSGCQYIIYGCTDPLASNYNPSANTNSGCSYPTPNITFGSNATIISGQSANLSWSIGNSTSRSMSNFGTIASSGSTNVSPTGTTIYTITANYYNYTSNQRSVTITVLQPVVANMTADSEFIARGTNTVLRWDVQGDASTATISPGIGSSNLNSFLLVSPTETTLYTLSASGPGGSDSAQVLITVYQPPEVTLNGPLSVDYGESITLSYEQVRCEEAFELQISTVDLDNNSTSETVNLGPSAAANDTYVYTPTYTLRGPFRVFFTLFGQATGGLTDSDPVIVDINIDVTPDAIVIPESEDKIKSEAPVITPDVTITTEQIVIDDIDIPVEIKADAQIQVEIDDDGIWQDVRQI